MGGWKDGRMEGWKDGRMEGWMEGKAGLRIAYSNQKCDLLVFIISIFCFEKLFTSHKTSILNFANFMHKILLSTLLHLNCKS